MSTLHPLTVHFPITLLLLWPVVDAVGWLTRREQVSQTALALLGLGVIAALVANVTGQAAYDAAIAASVAPELLDTHADLASLVPWIGLALVTLRFVLPGRLGRAGHALAIALGFAGGLCVALVGMSGGELVYEHGVGVRGVAR